MECITVIASSTVREYVFYVFYVFLQNSIGLYNAFLADRANGRAYATVLRPSSVAVCRLSVTVTLCIVAKRSVIQQKCYY